MIHQEIKGKKKMIHNYNTCDTCHERINDITKYININDGKNNILYTTFCSAKCLIIALSEPEKLRLKFHANLMSIEGIEKFLNPEDPIIKWVLGG